MNPTSQHLAMKGPVADSEELLRGRHVEAKRTAVAAHLDRISWSSERLAHERLRRLRRLLHIAKDRSPWHRRRLAEVDPHHVDEADLRQLPAMTKGDVMAHFDAIVTDPRLTLDLVEAHLAGLDERPRHLLGRYQAVASGGSSGMRGVFVYGWEAWTNCYLGWTRYLLRACSGRPFSMALVAAGHPSHISRALLQTFSDPAAINLRSFPVTLPLQQIVAGLNEFRPHVLAGYPSVLPRLVQATETGRLRIQPHTIVVGGEPLLPEIRQAAEAAWGAPIHNWWLCSEGGPMGIGCGGSTGLHLSDDLLIVEPVDAGGHPVPAGERSAKVYLTNLYNPTLPLIRYELTDEVTELEGVCPCGSQHRRVEDVQGRLDDNFIYPEVVVHPHVFRSTLGRERAIVEYKVRQTRRGAAIEIVCGGPVETARIREEISTGLARLGLETPEISITTVTKLERQDTGKLKCFLPLPVTEA
jgi:phenylacetate-CoA ligase